MRAVFLSMVVAIAVAALLVGPVGAARPEGSGEKIAHPAVEGDTDCAGCHRDLHPEVVGDWTAGKHGLNNVKCFICHGSVGADFRATPSATSCVGCHDSQVASMSNPAMEGRSCYGCHTSHRLSPHAGPHQGGE